jgi:aminodeoxyfutalosine synthase
LEIYQLSDDLKTNCPKGSSGRKELSFDEGVQLYEEGPLGYLGALANFIRTNRHGNITYFNRNFHIEPTNICVFDCKFCSYSRLLKHKMEGWEYSKEQMLDIVKSYEGKPVTEVHIVGGVHPKMGIHFFGDLIQEIKALRPEIHVKAFTAVELEYMCRKAKMSYKEGLQYLKDCGQNSLPGWRSRNF